MKQRAGLRSHLQKDIGINVSAYLITSSDFVKNNTETLTNYLKALDESVKYINDNLDESAEKISKKYAILKLS